MTISSGVLLVNPQKKFLSVLPVIGIHAHVYKQKCLALQKLKDTREDDDREQ